MTRRRSPAPPPRRVETRARYLPPDGVLGRGNDAERELNRIFAQVFGTEAGQKAIDYLRSITVFNVQGPLAPDHHLRHLEGQRYLLGIIEKRRDHGRRHLPAADAATAAAEPADAATGVDATA